VFVNHVELPRGSERERVYLRERQFDLRGSESRALSTIGAFRVVPAGDLRDAHEQPLDPRNGDLYHLRRAGLVQTMPVTGRDRALVVLTEHGRELLESCRCDHGDVRQAFYAGLRKPKELTHDAQIYGAYQRAADRLHDSGARIRRVVLDYELKRDYQRFLQEHNRGRQDSGGRPDRTPDEIRAWAAHHELPEHDGHVQFPDARIEYEDVDGRLRTEDIEVTTLHYRGAHASAKASAGFNRYRAGTMRIGGANGDGRRGRGDNPRLVEEVLR
jgi:hypothetical protein